MNGNSVPPVENNGILPHSSIESSSSNVTVKNSIMSAMILLVFSLCFVAVVTFLIGLIMLNEGIFQLFRVGEYVDRTSATADIVKGLVNLIIGIFIISGAYVFVMFTVERKSWWKKMR